MMKEENHRICSIPDSPVEDSEISSLADLCVFFQAPALMCVVLYSSDFIFSFLTTFGSGIGTENNNKINFSCFIRRFNARAVLCPAKRRFFFNMRERERI